MRTAFEIICEELIPYVKIVALSRNSTDFICKESLKEIIKLKEIESLYKYSDIYLIGSAMKIKRIMKKFID